MNIRNIFLILFLLIFAGCSESYQFEESSFEDGQKDKLNTSVEDETLNLQLGIDDENLDKNYFIIKNVSSSSYFECNNNIVCKPDQIGVYDNGTFEFVFTYTNVRKGLINQSYLKLDSGIICYFKDIINLDTLSSFSNLNEVVFLNGHSGKIIFNCPGINSNSKSKLKGEGKINVIEPKSSLTIPSTFKFNLAQQYSEKRVLNLNAFPKRIGDYKLDLDSLENNKDSSGENYIFTYNNVEDNTKVINIGIIKFDNNKIKGEIIKDISKSKEVFLIENKIIGDDGTILYFTKNENFDVIFFKSENLYNNYYSNDNISEYIQDFEDFSKNNVIKYFTSKFLVDLDTISLLNLPSISDFVDNYKDLLNNKIDEYSDIRSTITVERLQGDSIYIKNNKNENIIASSIKVLSKEGNLICDEVSNYVMPSNKFFLVNLSNCNILLGEIFDVVIITSDSVYSSEVIARGSSKVNEQETTNSCKKNENGVCIVTEQEEICEVKMPNIDSCNNPNGEDKYFTTYMCEESDDGYNLNLKGDVKLFQKSSLNNYNNNDYKIKTYTDFCEDDGDLVEFSCTENSLSYRDKTCENGCLNGACVILDTVVNENYTTQISIGETESSSFYFGDKKHTLSINSLGDNLDAQIILDSKLISPIKLYKEIVSENGLYILMTEVFKSSRSSVKGYASFIVSNTKINTDDLNLGCNQNSNYAAGLFNNQLDIYQNFCINNNTLNRYSCDFNYEFVEKNIESCENGCFNGACNEYSSTCNAQGYNKTISLGEGQSVSLFGKSISIQSVSFNKVLLTVDGISKSLDICDAQSVNGLNIKAMQVVSSSSDLVMGYTQLAVNFIPSAPQLDFNCVDSDNGRIGSIKGYTQGYGNVGSIYENEIMNVTDSCWIVNGVNKGLQEFSCNDNRVFWQYAECDYWLGAPSFCSDGVCILNSTN